MNEGTRRPFPSRPMTAQSREELLARLRDARTTLGKTATCRIGSEEVTIQRSFFDSAIRNIADPFDDDDPFADGEDEDWFDCAFAARPTPEIGEDELVVELRAEAEAFRNDRFPDDEGNQLARKLTQAADRLILYREALEAADNFIISELAGDTPTMDFCEASPEAGALLLQIRAALSKSAS